MRITHIHIIGEYKNLKDFKIDFDGNSFIDVFVGKNATGKSNFFEACLEIFKHIYDPGYPILFDYKFSYTIDEGPIAIEWREGRFIDGDGKETKPPSTKQLPDNILIYYSGHNPTIAELIASYEESHKQTINRNRNNKTFNSSDARRFLSIGREYKSLLLSIMLLQNDDVHAKLFLAEKLNIGSFGDEVKIVLKRPDYAINNASISFDEFDENKRFWGVEGFFKPFLDRLWQLDRLNSARIREEGYINTEEREEYILYRTRESFRSIFEDYSTFQVFIELDNLKTIGLLKEITLEVKLNSGKTINLNQFSDGQFQSIYIYAITELFKDKNCITLLDEPDSFLHPEWQFDFFKQIIEISSKSSESNHVLMSSHSAVTLLNSHEKRISLFRFHEGNIVVHKVDKAFAISQLSSNLIKTHQDKQILSIIHTVGQEKPILFTEGYSDPIILNEAWNQLYTEEMPFEIYFGHGCLYLRLLLQSEKFLSEMVKPVFGLFDFDQAYEQWNSISGEETGLLEADPFKGLIKKVRDKNSFAMLIPVPQIPEILQQVIAQDGKTYEGGSVLELEHCFYSDKTATHFKKISTPGGGEIIEMSDSKKMKFATDVVPATDKAYFEVFRAMFEFLKSKC